MVPHWGLRNWQVPKRRSAGRRPLSKFPQHIAAAWAEAGRLNVGAPRGLGEASRGSREDVADRYKADLSGDLLPAVAQDIEAFKKAASEGGAAQASRTSSQKILDQIAKGAAQSDRRLGRPYSFQSHSCRRHG